MADRASSEAGFSLMEVLVSLFILTIISTAGTGMLISSIDSRDSLETALERSEGVYQAHAVIRDDLAQWVPRDFRGREGLDLPSRFMGGSRGERGFLFSFVRDGWNNPGLREARGGLIQLRYMIENDQLIRRIWLGSNTVPGGDMVEQVLLDGIQNYDLQFRQGDTWINGWVAATGDPFGAPVAVKLDLELEDGRAFEWLFLTPTGSQVR